MFWKAKLNTPQARAGFCAGLAPILHTASGCPWYASLALCLLLCAVDTCAGERPLPLPLHIARELWNMLLGVTVLNWLCVYWTGFPRAAVAVSAVAMSLWVCTKPQRAAFRAWGVAFYGIAALAFGVLISAVGDVERGNLLPPFAPGMGWSAALGLLMAFRFGGGKSAFFLAPVGSLIAVGVLGLGVAVPFYELSRSIRFLGVAPRFEALCACAVTMSFLIGLTALLGGEETDLPGGWMKAMKTAWMLTLVYLGVQIPEEVLCLGLLFLWVVPSLLGTRVEMKLCTKKKAGNRKKQD